MGHHELTVFHLHYRAHVFRILASGFGQAVILHGFRRCYF
jgi:hypothetical protein